MPLPWPLFKLSERDQQVTWIDPVVQVQQVLAASASPVTPSISVPVDRMLLLHAAQVLGTGTGGQLALRVGIQLVDRGGTPFTFCHKTSEVAAGLPSLTTFWSGEMAIPSGFTISGFGSFNSGVASNVVSVSVYGMFVPVGNVQRL